MRSATLKTFFTRPGEWVSIHALLAECDVFRPPLLSDARSFNPRTPCGVRRIVNGKCKCSTWFQSTHSLRSATSGRSASSPSCAVSIHALLAECDCLFIRHHHRRSCFNPRTPCGVRRGGKAHGAHLRCFNPRTPCGVRPDLDMIDMWEGVFQSTHSLRSATDTIISA